MRNFSLTLGLLLAAAPAVADELSAEQTEFFESKIRPALIKYCYDCHSEESGKTRGGLLVDSKVGLLQGGDTGAAIIPHDAEGSLFYEAITWADADYEMPPKEKMPDTVIEDFRRWIEMGAPDPRIKELQVVENTIDLEEGKKHWAFQPVKAAGKSVDQHIAEKRSEKNLSAAAVADPETVLRRLYFDLVGLPPLPKEIAPFRQAWAADPDAAVSAVVDDLLSRPQFGERWGRHWLDVARFAESTGLDVNFTYPQAWRYRNYVVDAFNDDKPYDLFLSEQIAGDLLPAKTDEDWQENLIATGFLAVGTKALNEDNPRKFKMDVVDEQIDTVSRAFLGLTVSCARCHDHKYDPIPTMDYYALAGIFQSTDTFYGTTQAVQNKRPSQLISLPIPDKVSATTPLTTDEITELKDRLQKLRAQGLALRESEEDVPQSRRIRVRTQITQVLQKLDTVNADGTAKSLTMGVQDIADPKNGNVLIRGEVEKPAQEVPRGFLQVLDFHGETSIRESQSGRRDLTEWITSEENPLTARVMVNRIWQKIFGEGLVSTPNNWGTTGEAPSHPGLLDDLAANFVANEWSVKSVVREIVTSETYRLGAEYHESNFKTDPDNRYFWRTAPRQIDAEALRDAMLRVSGNLDTDRPHASVVAAHKGRIGRQIDPANFEKTNHRSVYLPLVRDMLPEALALFDFPDPSMPSAKRDETNMPSQALYLMNNDFVAEQAKTIAQLLTQKFSTRDERIQQAFALILSRQITEADFAACSAYFTAMLAEPGTTETLATEAFCQTLLASAEFRILN
ncbi:MAG: PSD1 and planctomycete cytochrome C domain-containing protein [Verrucomicrobiota bacterium]